MISMSMETVWHRIKWTTIEIFNHSPTYHESAGGILKRRGENKQSDCT